LADDKSVCYWVGSIDDIHEIVQTRFQLQAEQVRLAKMADASPQMLFSFRQGPEGRPSFPYVSPAFENTFGVKGEELAVDVSSFFMLGNPEDNGGIMQSVELSKQQMTLWTHQWRVRALDKGEIWVEAHSMPVRDADGGTTWHGTVSDVTARRQHEAVIGKLNADLEQRVTLRTEELESANRELEAFSYSVSHDLREPLRAVNGFAQALVEDYAAVLPSGAQHYLDAIRQGGLRMGRLIDDLLAFSRLSRQPLRRRTIDVALLVEGCLRELTLAEGGRATLNVGQLLPCEADPALLRQVFVNLLGNAFKYSRKRQTPHIEVLSQQDAEGRVVYVVKDNGTGFNMKYAHKLFQVFQRLHPREDFEGTGVGLAIVQRIVSRHGGRVWVDATPDVGATFSFTLGA
jgi:PAS domain S-box-containing protein